MPRTKQAMGGQGGLGDGGKAELEDGSPLSSYLQPGQPIDKDFVMSINIRSLNMGRKADFLADFVNRYKRCHIICIQEIWQLEGGIPTLPGFQKLYYKCRSNNRAGGVGIYVSDKFKYTELDSPFLESKIESIAIKVSVNPKKTIKVVNVYIRPNQNLEDILPLVSTLPVSGRNTLVMGDFNYNLLNKNNIKLVEKFQELGLPNIVNKPTRVVHTKKGTSKSLVDHIYTNIRGAENYIITTDISDHFTLCCTLQSNWKTRKKETKPSLAPLQDEKSIELLRQYFTAVDWTTVTEDSSKKCFKKFSNIVKEGMSICCPLTEKNRRTQAINPWMTRGLLVSRRVKDKLHHKAIKSSKVEHWRK